MGTLFNQEPRRPLHISPAQVGCEISDLSKIAIKNGVTFDQALEVSKLLELRRRTTAYIDNGDIWDEQIAGMCELIKEINETISDAILKAEEE